jgi:prepilin peptidase CpaA
MRGRRSVPTALRRVPTVPIPRILVAPDYLVIFGALLAVACASDVAVRRIPNALLAPFAVGGILSHAFASGARSAIEATLGGAAVFALLFLPWVKGKLGGGDLKLLTATAIWLGARRVPGFLVCTGLAGIPVALGSRAFHRMRLHRMVRVASIAGQSIEALAPPRETVPVAVAITIGAFAMLGWSVP